jgi:HEAT repeat protein
LEALTRHPLPAACSAVRRWLHGPHEALGVAAARALGALGDELSAGALVEAARDARDGRRAAALAELDRRASLPAAVIAPLEEMLATAPDAASLVPLLAAVGPAAAGALVGCLLAPDEGVRQTAARHLTVDGAHGLVPLPASGRQALAALAKAAGPPVTAELLLVVATCEPAVGDVFLAAALRADDWLLRNAAVDHLAARGGAEAVEPLRRALVALPCELDEPGRHHLQRLCDALRGCRAVDALAQLIARHALAPGQPGPWHAACALAESGLAGEALAAATSHRQREVRVGAVALLAEYPYPEAAEALLAELARQDGAAADGAHLADLARALGRMREPRAREPLAALRPNAGNGLADALDVALARLGDAAAKARVDAMLVREAWPDRRPAADYFRDLPDIPPRAAAIVQEADAHHRAQAILADGGRRASERLAALGASVGPSLREWLLAGWHRREVARALVQLGQTEALRVAGILDRLDELLPRLGEAEGVRAELEQIASAGPDLVRQYLREHGWEA